RRSWRRTCERKQVASLRCSPLRYFPDPPARLRTARQIWGECSRRLLFAPSPALMNNLVVHQFQRRICASTLKASVLVTKMLYDHPAGTATKATERHAAKLFNRHGAPPLVGTRSGYAAAEVNQCPD